MWVSKTQLTQYLRCPYTLWLLDRGLISFEETTSDLQRPLIQAGATFEEDIVKHAIPLPEPVDLDEVFQRESIRIFGLPVFENEALSIYGCPDGVETERGALLPVEIKSHKEVRRTDELELAFYWMLLEPLRTKRTTPKGVLILRDSDKPREVVVEIPSNRFDEVHHLLGEIREERRRRARPRVCKCFVCTNLMRDVVEEATAENKDLTLIFNVGHRLARALELMGIPNCEALLDYESSQVIRGLKEWNPKYFVSEAEIDRWKHHANAYVNSYPVLFGDAFPVGASFIAVDFEYLSPGALIWLIGVCVVKEGQQKYISYWADNAAEEKGNLQRLSRLFSRHARLPVITWAGRMADIPELKKAGARLKATKMVARLVDRQTDLFNEWGRNALRLPIPGFSLNEVASYFGIPRISLVRDGHEAQSRYLQYRAVRGNRKAALQAELIEYNRDDLDALVGIVKGIRGLN